MNLKPQLNLDFIRGVLFSYVAYQILALFITGYGLEFTESFRLIGLIGGVVLFLIYLAAAAALIFAPRSYSRIITIFFAITLVLQVAGAVVWAQHFPAGFSPFNRMLVSQLVVGALMVALATAFHFMARRREK